MIERRTGKEGERRTRSKKKQQAQKIVGTGWCYRCVNSIGMIGLLDQDW